MKTELLSYTAWWDGSVTVPADKVIDYIGKVPRLYVDRITKDIQKLNSFSPKNERLAVKEEVDPFDFGWGHVPEKYSKVNLLELCIGSIPLDISDNEYMQRCARVKYELQTFKRLGLYPFLHCLLYVVDVLTQNDIVWGVGRGSSVSSYVLYLIGIHEVDSHKYNLEFTDFIKD